MHRKVKISSAAVSCVGCFNNAAVVYSNSIFGRFKSVTESFTDVGRKTYHSDNGVYGHRPKSEEEYTVPEEALQSRNSQGNFYRLVTAYRELGHKTARTNPVDLRKNYIQLRELNPERFGLSSSDQLDFRGILNVPQRWGTLSEAVAMLQNLYCEYLSSEFTYLESEEEREWFAQRVEGASNEELSSAEKVVIATELLKSQAWDHFLALKFPSVKRYGGEGAEGIMAFFTELFKLSCSDTLENVVLGMPHRGKLNLLTGLLGCPPNKIFMKYRGLPEFSRLTNVMADIPNHYSVSQKIEIDGNSFTISMLNNPSHLEVVNPVSMGKTRSKQQVLQEGDYSNDPKSRLGDKVLNIQLHGDAAFAGQGINQECLMMAQTPNFDVGGSIHVIVNNQIGFTTPGERGRSSRYCSDLAKSINAPVMHVNADHPELIAKATRIAFEYERKFRKDIFIDLNCFRRWGHNEVDDPTFTNPLLYQIVNERRSVPDLYSEKLIEEGVWKKEDADLVVSQHTEWLAAELKNLDKFEPDKPYYQAQWENMTQAPSAIETWDTGARIEELVLVGTKSVQYPSDFAIHGHIKKTHIASRMNKIAEGNSIDWSTAEAMAIGTLLLAGHNVRFSGEDVGRGTFSNRHIMMVDQESNDIYIPLNDIVPEQKAFLEMIPNSNRPFPLTSEQAPTVNPELDHVPMISNSKKPFPLMSEQAPTVNAECDHVANSILSEEAVLGFEYGMAADHPNNLIIWESQFGDFFNGAQIIIDTYISSGETKWMKSNGLVMLLPHGYDGAGAEHSSSRMERFLQLTDSKEDQPDGEDINMQVVNVTKPSQYFHLLRRQIMRNYRKPLVIISPKTLLRMSEAASSLKDMEPGTHFIPVLGDDIAEAPRVKKVIITSGKHYYGLDQERRDKQIRDVAILRLESLCPFPLVHLQAELEKYKNARTFIWSQEEPRNMGAWTFVKPRFENLAGRKLVYCGRKVAACPAVGVSSWHREEAQEVIEAPFKIQ